MMTALFIMLIVWLRLSRANADSVDGSEATAYLETGSDNASYNFSCYECRGTVGEVTNCGESLTMEEDIVQIATVPCNHVCTKAVSYKIDQKIYVTRNCSQSCDPGCAMAAGTGTCWYCCTSELCNGASAIASWDGSFLLIGMWSMSKAYQLF
ncbi:uncharacterized protein [Diadema antillarum]|uniref:uncharacterized protein n=1 Tax=Diadema antillarum TaxID=105358 RepID=UPI003A8B9180